MNIPILFEDEYLLVIDKPAGVVVNRSDTSKTDTVQDFLDNSGKITSNASQDVSSDQVQEKSNWGNDFVLRSGIVHRLDKETSGLLVIAKTSDAFLDLQRQFKERKTKKTYIAIVHGFLKPNAGEINVPIGRLPWNRMRFGVVVNGKESVTRYQVKKELSIDGVQFSVVELYPQTGRTHQLRVHLTYIGHPIVGDDLYSGRKRSRDSRILVGRLMLHAWKLEIDHPSTTKRLAFVSPIPDDMNRILDHATG